MGNDILIQMGLRLATRRKELNITQEVLAERMGVSIQMVSNMEQGKKAIRPENLIKVCEVLNISTDYALTGLKTEKENNDLFDRIRLLSDRDKGTVEALVKYLSE